MQEEYHSLAFMYVPPRSLGKHVTLYYYYICQRKLCAGAGLIIIAILTLFELQI